MADGAEGGAEPPVPLGTRVVVNGRYKGTLRFFGEVGYAPGLFAGVELDDPAGKNDGAVKGRRYFKCKPHHGILVRPHYVEVLQSFLDRRPHEPVLLGDPSAARTPARGAPPSTPASMLGARTPATSVARPPSAGARMTGGEDSAAQRRRPTRSSDTPPPPSRATRPLGASPGPRPGTGAAPSSLPPSQHRSARDGDDGTQAVVGVTGSAPLRSSAHEDVVEVVPPRDLSQEFREAPPRAPTRAPVGAPSRVPSSAGARPGIARDTRPPPATHATGTGAPSGPTRAAEARIPSPPTSGRGRLAARGRVRGAGRGRGRGRGRGGATTPSKVGGGKGAVSFVGASQSYGLHAGAVSAASPSGTGSVTSPPRRRPRTPDRAVSPAPKPAVANTRSSPAVARAATLTVEDAPAEGEPGAGGYGLAPEVALVVIAAVLAVAFFTIRARQR